MVLLLEDTRLHIVDGGVSRSTADAIHEEHFLSAMAHGKCPSPRRDNVRPAPIALGVTVATSSQPADHQRPRMSRPDSRHSPPAKIGQLQPLPAGGLPVGKVPCRHPGAASHREDPHAPGSAGPCAATGASAWAAGRSAANSSPFKRLGGEGAGCACGLLGRVERPDDQG